VLYNCHAFYEIASISKSYSF